MFSELKDARKETLNFHVALKKKNKERKAAGQLNT